VSGDHQRSADRRTADRTAGPGRPRRRLAGEHAQPAAAPPRAANPACRVDETWLRLCAGRPRISPTPACEQAPCSPSRLLVDLGRERGLANLSSAWRSSAARSRRREKSEPESRISKTAAMLLCTRIHRVSHSANGQRSERSKGSGPWACWQSQLVPFPPPLSTQLLVPGLL